MIAGLILAAGRSERMGLPKALLRADDDSFLGTIFSKLSTCGVDEIVVVLGHEADRVRSAVPRGASIVDNPRFDDGMLSSIVAGLGGLREGCSGVLLWPVDHPRVLETTVRQLLAVGGPLAVPRYRGTRGHPVLLGSELFDELRAAPPDEGARAVVHAHLTESTHVDVDDPGICEDLDSPEAYRTVFGRAPRPA